MEYFLFAIQEKLLEVSQTFPILNIQVTLSKNNTNLVSTQNFYCPIIRTLLLDK